jgi:hypothetical protein
LFRNDVGNLVNDAKGKKPMYVEKTKKDVVTHPKGSVRAEQMWRRPDHGWIKINVDASFLEDPENGSWGAIARTDAGLLSCLLGALLTTVSLQKWLKPSLVLKD